MEYPQWQCHKKVRALEIEETDRLTCTITFKDFHYPKITVTSDMWSRYKPVPGDFYVVYEDGYATFSPRKAFLEGYAKL